MMPTVTNIVDTEKNNVNCSTRVAMFGTNIQSPIGTSGQNCATGLATPARVPVNLQVLPQTQPIPIPAPTMSQQPRQTTSQTRQIQQTLNQEVPSAIHLRSSVLTIPEIATPLQLQTLQGSQGLQGLPRLPGFGGVSTLAANRFSPAGLPNVDINYNAGTRPDVVENGGNFDTASIATGVCNSSTIASCANPVGGLSNINHYNQYGCVRGCGSMSLHYGNDNINHNDIDSVAMVRSQSVNSVINRCDHNPDGIASMRSFDFNFEL